MLNIKCDKCGYSIISKEHIPCTIGEGKMSKRKCKYCETDLKAVGNIRCDKCDEIWQDGYNAGEIAIKREVGACFKRFLNWGI